MTEGNKIMEFIQTFLDDDSEIKEDELQLYEQALTYNPSSNYNNRTLALLGDSVLNFIIRNHLFKEYPVIDNVGITKRCEKLESNEYFKTIAVELGIFKYLILDNELINNSTFKADNKDVNATTFEALFGAV
ncbi:MAG: hypothetical protein K8S18_17225 [Desulfobacula sp.]|nr:hypothetical protein [Desulfobacula sp.]